MSKTIFITGASTGIGKATAIYFASKDWNVIATMRNPDGANELNAFANITISAIIPPKTWAACIPTITYKNENETRRSNLIDTFFIQGKESI